MDFIQTKPVRSSTQNSDFSIRNKNKKFLMIVKVLGSYLRIKMVKDYRKKVTNNLTVVLKDLNINFLFFC